MGTHFSSSLRSIFLLLLFTVSHKHKIMYVSTPVSLTLTEKLAPAGCLPLSLTRALDPILCQHLPHCCHCAKHSCLWLLKVRPVHPPHRSPAIRKLLDNLSLSEAIGMSILITFIRFLLPVLAVGKFAKSRSLQTSETDKSCL